MRYRPRDISDREAVLNESTSQYHPFSSRSPSNPHVHNTIHLVQKDECKREREKEKERTTVRETEWKRERERVRDRETRETVCTLHLCVSSRDISVQCQNLQIIQLHRILILLKAFIGPEIVPRDVVQRVRDKRIILHLRQTFVSPWSSDKKKYMFSSKRDYLGIIILKTTPRVISNYWRPDSCHGSEIRLGIWQIEKKFLTHYIDWRHDSFISPLKTCHVVFLQ